MASKASVNFTGYLLRVAQKKKNVFIRHKLDTDLDKYYKILHDTVIPECAEVIKEIPGISQRVKDCISYTTPTFFEGWNYNIELVYKMVAEEHHQTEENLKKIRILRALQDMCYSMIGILDDITDKGEYRVGKKIWGAICEGGQEAAIHDTYTVNYLITCILKRHFRYDPGYTRMLEIFSYTNGTMAIGQTLDVLGRSNFNYNDDIWKCCINYKAGKPFSTGPALGLLHAGITCDDLIQKTMNIFEYYGHLLQVWDDFMEFYSVKEQSGKGQCDSNCNVNSWATVTAMRLFNAAQAEEFKACYGCSDPDKKSRVRALFDEVNLPGKYLDHLEEIRMTVEKDISKLPNARIRKASTSFLEYLVGEKCHDVQQDGLQAL